MKCVRKVHTDRMCNVNADYVVCQRAAKCKVLFRQPATESGDFILYILV